jgi:hypothetical protein
MAAELVDQRCLPLLEMHPRLTGSCRHGLVVSSHSTRFCFESSSSRNAHCTNDQNSAPHPAATPKTPTPVADKFAASAGCFHARTTDTTPHRTTAPATHSPSRSIANERKWPPNIACGSWGPQVSGLSAIAPARDIASHSTTSVRTGSSRGRRACEQHPGGNRAGGSRRRGYSRQWDGLSDQVGGRCG